MKVSVSLTDYSWPVVAIPDAIASLARRLDDTAADTLWVADHLLQADLIGGVGERRTLRLVAEYADACNLFDIPDGGQTLRRKLEVLQRHCTDVVRPYRDIERTVTTALDNDSVESLTGRCRHLHTLGAQHVVLITRGRPWTAGDCDVVAAVRAPGGTPLVHLDAVQIRAEFHAPVKHRRRFHAPLVLLAGSDRRHAVGEH